MLVSKDILLPAVIISICLILITNSTCHVLALFSVAHHAVKYIHTDLILSTHITIEEKHKNTYFYLILYKLDAEENCIHGHSSLKY
jgi:hypothetical protein